MLPPPSTGTRTSAGEARPRGPPGQGSSRRSASTARSRFAAGGYEIPCPMRERDMPLYLEDFAVGQKHVTAGQHLDAEAIKAFARQFDPQPFHLDEDAA